MFETLRVTIDQEHKKIFEQKNNFFCDGTEISILIINIQFISQNKKIIFSVSSLLLLCFLNFSWNTEARPTDALSYNDSFLSPSELENPNSDREESGLRDEKFLHLQLYTANDNAIVEGPEQLEESTKPGLQETGIQDEASAVGATDAKVAQVSRTARNAGNACVKQYVYRIIYNWVFKIPVCKQGCKSKFKSANFSNNKTLAIAYDCYI